MFSPVTSISIPKVIFFIHIPVAKCKGGANFQLYQLVHLRRGILVDWGQNVSDPTMYVYSSSSSILCFFMCDFVNHNNIYRNITFHVTFFLTGQKSIDIIIKVGASSNWALSYIKPISKPSFSACLPEKKTALWDNA